MLDTVQIRIANVVKEIDRDEEPMHKQAYVYIDDENNIKFVKYTKDKVENDNKDVVDLDNELENSQQVPEVSEINTQYAAVDFIHRMSNKIIKPIKIIPIMSGCPDKQAPCNGQKLIKNSADNPNISNFFFTFKLSIIFFTIIKNKIIVGTIPTK